MAGPAPVIAPFSFWALMLEMVFEVLVEAMGSAFGAAPCEARGTKEEAAAVAVFEV
jgi:hypothetical protein